MAGDIERGFSAMAVPAAAVALESVDGAGQAGSVGEELASVLVVRALDPYGNPTPGAGVAWETSDGSGTVVPADETTNEAGLAEAVWTLGGGAGSQSVWARLEGGAGDPIEFGATGLPGDPDALAFVTHPADATAGEPVGEAVTVAVRDSYGNTVTEAIGTVTVALEDPSGLAALQGTTSGDLADGVVAFDDLVVERAGEDYALTATWDPLPSATSVLFDVFPDLPAAVAVSIADETLTSLGTTTTAEAAVTDRFGNAIAGAEVSWSTDDGTVATVHDGGVVTAMGNGTANLTATAAEGVTGSVAVVVQQEVAEVLVDEPDPLTALGDEVQLEARPVDANGYAVEDVSVAWSTSDDAVAAVDATTGAVSAVGNGEATVTAAVEDTPFTSIVIVVRQAVADVVLTPGDDVLLDAVGDTAHFVMLATDANGIAIPDAVVTWTSSDPSVATVDLSGLVTAVGPGAISLSAEVEGGSATTTFVITVGIVVEPEVVGVRVTPDGAEFDALGSVVLLTPDPIDANGYPVGDGAPTSLEWTWRSTDEAVVVVDGDGRATAAGNGSALVIVEASGMADTITAFVAQRLRRRWWSSMRWGRRRRWSRWRWMRTARWCRMRRSRGARRRPKWRR
jgi:uncharacterized protein YjdB